MKRKIKGTAGCGPVCDSKQITDALTSLKTKAGSKNEVIDLEVISDGYDLKPLKNQIRKFFEWSFSPDGMCRSRELTGNGEWTTQAFEEKGKDKRKGKSKEEEEEEEDE